MAVLRHSTTARNAAADAVLGLLDAGSGPGVIQIRSGGLPASPQAAASGTLLATITLSDPVSGAASSGTDTITDPVSVTGVADGTAGWARFQDSAGNAVLDVDVTATGGGGAITLSTTTISVGVTVDMAALTYTVPV